MTWQKQPSQSDEQAARDFAKVLLPIEHNNAISRAKYEGFVAGRISLRETSVVLSREDAEKILIRLKNIRDMLPLTHGTIHACNLEALELLNNALGEK